MAEPEIVGDIAFSEILDGTQSETFIVNAILEPTCDADFCDNFNEYAFQKLPTFRDNFNYPTQSSADANWISSDLPQIRVNAVTEEIDYDWTQNGTIEAVSFDLGADTVNKEKWALRFKFVLNSFTKADASPNLPFIGLATANSSSVTMDGDGIGFQVEVRTGEPVDLNIFHRDDATSNKDLVGDQGTDVVVNIDADIPETYYVELRRESATKAVCDVYSDAQFITLLGSGSITMDDLTSDLRYILIAGRDNSGMNLLDGTIDDLEFWNGGQQGDITFEDNFKQKKITFGDDFVTDNWADAGTDILVNTGTQVIDWDANDTSINHATAFDLGTSGINDTQWVLRAKVVVNNVTAGASADSNRLYLGLFDSDQSVDSNTTQDGLFIGFLRGNTSNQIGLYHRDGAVLDAGADVAFTTTITATTFFVEVKRTSATLGEITLYSDSTYSTVIEHKAVAIPSTISSLRFIKAQNRSTLTGDSVLDGTIDDVEFYNGNSTLTNWTPRGFATLNDVGLDTIDKRINFDIPQGVERDELLVHDLQTSIGVNADENNWTLRFKINTDSITQGTSEQSASLFVGLDDAVLASNVAPHDFIAFGVVIDQGGAGPQFGATPTLRTADAGEYFTGTVGSNFPFMWATGTLYVEVKRTSLTTAECTLYSDANFTEVFSTPQQVTIASTLDNLRFIRITTDSSAVANDTTWDGSIDDVEFYNGVSVSRSPVHETKDFEDTFLADNWADQGTGVEVNTGTQVIDWTSILDSVAKATVFDLGAGNVSDTEWALRFKYRTDTLTAGSTRTKYFWIGLFDSDQTVDSESVQDFIGFEFFVNSTLSVGRFSLSEKNNVILTGTGTQADLTTTPSDQLGNNLYVEVRRLTSTRAICSLYSDKDYSILIERISLTVPAGIIDLRYIGLKNRTDPVNTGSMTGIVDDVQFWNKQNALDHQNKWRKIDL